MSSHIPREACKSFLNDKQYDLDWVRASKLGKYSEIYRQYNQRKGYVRISSGADWYFELRHDSDYSIAIWQMNLSPENTDVLKNLTHAIFVSMISDNTIFSEEPVNLKHFIDTQDFSKQELLDLIHLTLEIKAADKVGATPKLLQDASLAMILRNLQREHAYHLRLL